MAKRRTLKDQVGDSLRQGRKMSALVIDVFYEKATVRLGGTGQVLHNLTIIGGPIEAGDTVLVDFTGIEPTVVAQGVQGLTSSDLDSALKKIAEETLSQPTQIKVTLFTGGASIATFEPSPEGLQSALTSANIGDVIWLPDVDITSDITIPSGVSLVGISSRQSIIRGTVTLNPDCSLESLAVISAVRTVNEVNAVIAQGAGNPSWIKNCEIHAYNCGSGEANAISILAATERLQITNSVIVADAAESSTAHAFTGAGGECHISDSRVYSKSAEHFYGTTFYVHANIAHVSEIDRMCIPVVAEDNQIHQFYPVPAKWGFMPRQDWSSTTEHLFLNEPTGGNYPKGSHSKFEEFVYQNISLTGGARTIREVRTTDGNTTDVVVCATPTSANLDDYFISVTKRELNVLIKDGTTYKVYKVNFETQTSQIVYQFNTVVDDGDPVTGVGYKYYENLIFLPMKADDGNLYLVMAGNWKEFYREDETYGDVYTSGSVFFIKNWTEDSGWSKQEGPKFYDDTVAFNQDVSGLRATVVDARYIVVACDNTWGNITSDITALGAWSFDVIDGVIKQSWTVQVPKYSSFSPSPANIHHSQLDLCAYVLYNGSDYSVTGVWGDAVWKYNPVNGSFVEYLRATGSEDYNFLFSNNDQVYMMGDVSSVVFFIELSGKTKLVDSLSYPVWSAYSFHLNDSAEMVWFEKTAAEIGLWDVTTGTHTMVATGITPADVASLSLRIYPMNGCYILWGQQYISSGVYNTKIWCIVDGA